MYKTDVKFSSDGEDVTHAVYREFYFEEMLSIASDETSVIVPNIPLFGLIKAMSKMDKNAKEITRDTLEGYASEGIDTTPFIKLTIKELFWGYPSVILSMDRQQKNKKCISGEELEFARMFGEALGEDEINCDIRQGNLVPFSVFQQRNATSLDFRTVKPGKFF